MHGVTASYPHELAKAFRWFYTVIMVTILLNVLIERRGDLWIAQCLQHDLATQARSLHFIHEELTRFFAAHIESSEARGADSFEIPPAPPTFWSKFEAAPAVFGARELITTPRVVVRTEARIAT